MHADEAAGVVERAHGEGVEPPAVQHVVAAESPAQLDTSNLGALWTRVQRAGGATNPLVRAVLANCTLVSVQGGGGGGGGDAGPCRVLISAAPSWAHRAVKWTDQIGELLGQQLGAKAIVEWAGGQPTQEGGAEGDSADARADGASVPASSANQPVLVTDHPLVQRAIELFGGRVVDVQPRRK